MSNFNFEYMGDYLQYKDSQGNTLIVNGGIINETATGAVAEFTDGAENIPVKSLIVTMNPIQEGSGDPSPENIRPISGRTTIKVWRESTYDTSAEPIITVQLGNYIYGGTVNIITGVMNVNRGFTVISELWNWVKSSTYSGGFFTDQQGLLRYKKNTPFISSHAKTALTTSQYLYGTCFCDNSINFRIMNADASNQDWIDYIVAQKTNGTPIQICYELAEPITVQLTPEQLTTLLGTNYIWSDADSVSVDYVADTKLYIDSKIPATNENRETVKDTIKETENPDIIEVKEI